MHRRCNCTTFKSTALFISFLFNALHDTTFYVHRRCKEDVTNAHTSDEEGCCVTPSGIGNVQPSLGFVTSHQSHCQLPSASARIGHLVQRYGQHRRCSKGVLSTRVTNEKKEEMKWWGGCLLFTISFKDVKNQSHLLHLLWVIPFPIHLCTPLHTASLHL